MSWTMENIFLISFQLNVLRLKKNERTKTMDNRMNKDF
jgi:hypothetical protein